MRRKDGRHGEGGLSCCCAWMPLAVIAAAACQPAASPACQPCLLPELPAHADAGAPEDGEGSLEHLVGLACGNATAMQRRRERGWGKRRWSQPEADNPPELKSSSTSHCPPGRSTALQRSECLTVWRHGVVLWQAEGRHQLVVVRGAHAVVGSPPILTKVVGGAGDVAVAAVGFPEGLRNCRQAARQAGGEGREEERQGHG